MSIDHILTYEGIAGKCHVACDETQRPIQLFYAPFSQTSNSAYPGQNLRAIVRASAAGEGGSFLQSETGETLFLSHNRSVNLVEGERCEVFCLSSARRGKYARVRLLRDDDVIYASSEGAWNAGFVQIANAKIIDTPESHLLIDDILESMCTPVATLPSGGRLTIAPTEALVAVDVDTAGRKSSSAGSAGIQSINVEAANELARQICLRDLGGAIVLDCVGQIRKSQGHALRRAFLDTFKTMSLRTVEALPPSKFGLMEIAIAWGRQPIHERLLDDNQRLHPDTELWQALRRLECEAAQRRMEQLVLELPEDAFALFQSRRVDYMQRIKARFGSRIDVRLSSRQRIEVTSR